MSGSTSGKAEGIVDGRVSKGKKKKAKAEYQDWMGRKKGGFISTYTED